MMTIRSASLLAAVALAGLAAPALAQDDHYGPPPYEGDWEGVADDGNADVEVYEDENGREVRVIRIHRDDFEGNGPGLPPLGPGFHGEQAPQQLGYSPEQRAEWLAQCRATRVSDRNEDRGEVIGGVLGAVAGGVAGNRIAGRGDRLAGTLIGGGVGALGGAVIGGAVGRDADRDDARDECEAYLDQYEHGYAAGPGYGPGPHGPGMAYGHGGPHAYAYGAFPGAYGYAYPYPYPVMWVKVPIMREHNRGCGCQEVVEEVVEERVAPAPRPRRPRPDKVVPLRPVK
jgi:hypothetical protein